MNIKGIIVGAIVVAIIIVGGVLVFSRPKTNPGLTATLTPVQEQQNVKVITLTKDGFSPNNLVVSVGTSVKWVNNSGAVAAVDSDPHPIHTSYPPMNFGSFSDGSSEQLTFDKAGIYHYHNHLNPSQTGTITVQ